MASELTTIETPPGVAALLSHLFIFPPLPPPLPVGKGGDYGEKMLAAIQRPGVELPANHTTTMGHIREFESELRKRIEAIQPGAEPEELVAWLKEQVLQSYRNDLATRASAGKDGERATRRYQKK